jgi:uncharacterized protein (DUF952 family)
MIYHLAYAQDWDEAKRTGEYTMSTNGRTLADEGFIHAGTADQVLPVANLIFKGEAGLLVLVIDPDRVTSEIRWERVRGWEDPFPHIWGPLNVDAVVEVRPFEPGPEGRFSFSG